MKSGGSNDAPNRLLEDAIETERHLYGSSRANEYLKPFSGSNRKIYLRSSSKRPFKFKLGYTRITKNQCLTYVISLLLVGGYLTTDQLPVCAQQQQLYSIGNHQRLPYRVDIFSRFSAQPQPSQEPQTRVNLAQQQPPVHFQAAAEHPASSGSSTARKLSVEDFMQPMNEHSPDEIELPPGSSTYVIDQKRFVETMSTRCMASTIVDDLASIEPSFVLITRKSEVRLNATAPMELIHQMAGFNSRLKTVIFVHGFTQSYPSTDWLRHARARFEENQLVGRYNVIFMDYGRASQGNYPQVAARVNVMGSFLAAFVMKLLNLGADRMSIHIVGHSLGAHVASYAGKRIRPRLGRITALDAAGPCFGKVMFNGPGGRLSPDDAFQVDAYHYDDGVLGLSGQYAQFDVYVNGGGKQPGCSGNLETIVQAALTVLLRRNRVLSESHTRSTEVATTRLSATNCQQVAYECRDYSSFLLGECAKCDDHNNQCYFMGFPFQYDSMEEEQPLRSSFPGKRLYISTGTSGEPFCTQHYQILVKFEPTQEMTKQAKRQQWRIYVEFSTNEPLRLLNGSKSHQRLNATLVNQIAPHVFSHLLLAEVQPVRIQAAQLQVRQSDGSPVVASLKSQTKSHQSPVRVLSVEVNFMSNINPNIRRSMSSRLCPIGQQAYAANSIADSSSDSGWLHLEECN